MMLYSYTIKSNLKEALEQPEQWYIQRFAFSKARRNHHDHHIPGVGSIVG
jgi:hypothetical protein